VARMRSRQASVGARPGRFVHLERQARIHFTVGQRWGGRGRPHRVLARPHAENISATGPRRDARMSHSLACTGGQGVTSAGRGNDPPRCSRLVGRGCRPASQRIGGAIYSGSGLLAGGTEPKERTDESAVAEPPAPTERDDGGAVQTGSQWIMPGDARRGVV